jgi:hypothetical protein
MEKEWLLKIKLNTSKGIKLAKERDLFQCDDFEAVTISSS